MTLRVMYAKSWLPEILAILYFGWMVALSGCNPETIHRVCGEYFQRAEEQNACTVGAIAAQDTRHLQRANEKCEKCFLRSGGCEYVDGGVIRAPDESRADFANRRTDLYTACYKGAEGYLELNR